MAIQRASKSGATAFKFEKKGDTLKGYFQGVVEKIINDSPAKEHMYKTKTGLMSVLGQANILTQYSNNGVTPGTYVELCYTGDVMKLKGGRTMKIYDVDYDLSNRDNSLSELNTSKPEDIEGVVNSEGEEEGLFDDAAPFDEVAPTQASAPIRNVSSLPSNQAKTQALLNKQRNKTA